MKPSATEVLHDKLAALMHCLCDVTKTKNVTDGHLCSLFGIREWTEIKQNNIVFTLTLQKFPVEYLL